MSGTVSRSLYYYDLYAMYMKAGSGKYQNSNRKIDDFFVELYNKQQGVLGYSDFLRKTRNGDDFFVIVDSIEDTYVEFRIVLCRTDALPFIEKGGKLDKLGDYIDDDQNIAEITHCVYFRKYGAMGGEYNFSGARPTVISDYITKYGIEADIVTCRAKLNYDAYTRLIEGEEFTLFDFSIKTNSDVYNEVLSKKSIFSAIQATVPESDTMEIVLKRRKTKKNQFSGFVAPLGLDEIKTLLTDYREDIERFKVSQNTFSNQIDLLSDKFVHKITMLETNERTINSGEMYKQIKEYFDSEVAMYCTE